jgi:hypothetical protein
MKNVFLVCAVLMASVLTVCGQSLYPAVKGFQGSQLPKVFLIGEYSEEFEAMSAEYKDNLMSVCNYDMDVAYKKWMSMLQEMETYSDRIDYDLKGIKIWLKVFIEPDGTVKHIAYYLKPRSRNVDVEELTAFLSSFMNNYKFPLINKTRYSHYGSASFPTIPQVATDK